MGGPGQLCIRPLRYRRGCLVTALLWISADGDLLSLLHLVRLPWTGPLTRMLRWPRAVEPSPCAMAPPPLSWALEAVRLSAESWIISTRRRAGFPGVSFPALDRRVDLAESDARAEGSPAHRAPSLPGRARAAGRLKAALYAPLDHDGTGASRLGPLALGQAAGAGLDRIVAGRRAGGWLHEASKLLTKDLVLFQDLLELLAEGSLVVRVCVVLLQVIDGGLGGVLATSGPGSRAKPSLSSPARLRQSSQRLCQRPSPGRA